jgi:hypothetical protein
MLRAWLRVKSNKGVAGVDKLIQQAICQVISPIFDPWFSESSFGFRPGRSAHDAVLKAREYIRKGYRIAVMSSWMIWTKRLKSGATASSGTPTTLRFW